MQKIIPHLWFDNQAEEAANFYTSVFANSKVAKKTHYGEAGKEIHKQDKGTVMTVEFELEGYKFIGLNAGPVFKFNPSISFYVNCKSASEVEELYTKLVEGGNVMMELDKYPFSEKYAWIEDKYGVSWQLIISNDSEQKIIPCILFVGDNCGKAEEAINFYTSIFRDSKVGDLSRYGENQEPNNSNHLNFGLFIIEKQKFVAMDSALDHKFNFNEAVSFLVECDDQREVDYYWERLSAVKDAEQCGWLKDKFGVSWQISPRRLHELMDYNNNTQKAEKVMNAMLKMKKIDIDELERVYNGN